MSAVSSNHVCKTMDPWLHSMNPGRVEIKWLPQQSYVELFSLAAVDSWLLIHFIETLSVPWIKGSI